MQMETKQSGRRQRSSDRRREPADAHFRKLAATASAPHPEAGDTSGRFEIYRAHEIRMTSTRFSGGDWHWRLCDAAGQVLLDTGGYASEGECLNAVAILQQNAGSARLSPSA
jgi:uncharacterized protein YegP (UPF0339 family)